MDCLVWLLLTVRFVCPASTEADLSTTSSWLGGVLTISLSSGVGPVKDEQQAMYCPAIRSHDDLAQGHGQVWLSA